MVKFKPIKTFISYVLVICLVLSNVSQVVFADEIEIIENNFNQNDLTEEFISLDEEILEQPLENNLSSDFVNEVFNIDDEGTFTDNFNDNSNWDFFQGNWNVENNWISVNSGQGYKAVTKDASFSNVDFTTTMKITGGTGDAGVLFRVSSASDGGDNLAGYYAGINLGANSIILGKMNYNWTQLASRPKQIEANKEYTVRITVFGSLIKVYVDDVADSDTPAITFIDESHKDGKIGLRIYNAAASYSNVIAKNFSPALAADSFDPVFITTMAKIAPVMPQKVNAIFNDGSKEEIDVIWDEIDPSSYNEAGAFTVFGSVEGTDKKVEALVTVMPAQIEQGMGEVVLNQGELLDTPFTPLPLGSVTASGWILEQLELQKSGATGNSEELYNELKSNSGWLGGNAPNSDWERPVYYVKGLVSLAYSLRDDELIGKVGKWIEWALESQDESGYFGPKSSDDWWPRMPMLYAMKDYCEATGDKRIIDFMINYFDYQLKNLPTRNLRDWGKQRAGDNIEVVLWLYNRVTDAEVRNNLLSLAELLKEQAYPHTDIFTNNKFYSFENDFHPHHSVNVGQAIKMPSIFYQYSKDEADKEAFRKGDEHLLRVHGQVTGMPSGTEFLAGPGSTQGAELCAIVERMQSNEIAQMILGDPYIGDQLEKIAFNALPGGMGKDLRTHQYYTLPNQVQSIEGGIGFRQDYSNGINPGINSGFECCVFNFHMGWPYYVKNMWAATSDNGAVDGNEQLQYI